MPVAVGLFHDVASPISVAFLRRFPDPTTVRQADKPAFVAFFRAQHYTHPQRIELLYEQTHRQAPEADPVVVHAQHHDHATILRGLGQKWAKILYTLWSSGEAYDEAHHIAQLKCHMVVWATSL
jgi:hypothetical protein